MNHEGCLEVAFDNLRNLLICGTLIATACGVFGNRDVLPLDPRFNALLASLVFAAGVGFLLWNLWHGMRKLREYRASKWVIAGLLAVYAVLGVQAVTALPLLMSINAPTAALRR